MASRSVALLATLGTYGTVIATVPSTRTWPVAATVASLMILPAALGTSVFSWVAWRLSPFPSTAWLTAATTMIGVQWPLLAFDADADYASIGTVSSAVVVGLAVLLLASVAARLQLRVAPIPIGVGLGLLLLLVPIAWARSPLDDLALPDRASSETVGVALLLAIGALVAAAVVRGSTLRTGVGGLAAAAFLWTWSTALGITDLVEQPGWSIVAVTVGLGATVLLLSVGVDLLLLSMGDELATVRNLERELQFLREQTRADVEHLHEVKGTIAGIASASALIRNERRLEDDQRDRLTEMLSTESARLSRLFEEQPSGGAGRTADLDDIIRPLVVAHRVQGHDVVWHAPPTAIAAPADPLAEVVNILLHNASQHAPGAPVWVYTRDAVDSPHHTELVVVDLGPGIHESQQRQVFEWGWRGPDSRGRGVGLAIAADVVSGMGGTLRLEPRQRRGTCFVIDLPRHPSDVVPRKARVDDGAFDTC